MATIDLETAAHEAVVKVQPLLQQLGDAEKECEAAWSHLQALDKQLVEDRKALLEAVEALAQEADAIGTQLAEDVSGAVAALGGLTAAVRQAGTDGSEDLDAEKTGLENAGTLVSELGPHVTEVAVAAEAASHGALEGATAVVQGLEEALQKIVQIVGVDLPFLAVEVKKQVEAAVTELLSFLEDKCTTLLDTKEGEWDEKLATAQQLVDTSLEAVRVHAREVTTHTQEKWTEVVDEEMTEIESEVTTLTDALSSLTKAVIDKDGEVKVAAEAVGERLQDGTEAAVAVEGALNGVRGRWATFGITG
jgi:hypothetical protein